jgi:phage antirepressor YoqD-like protein
MSNLTFNGQAISQRQDGYLNATQMAKANQVRLNDWFSLSQTNDYLNTLSQQTGIPAASLVISVSEGFPAQNSTWVHPLAALMFGRWVSPEFSIWCDMHIKTLMETGSTRLASQQPELPALPTALEIGKMFVAAETERLRLAAELEAAQPAIEFTKAIEASSNTVSMGEMAKMLGIGRSTFFGKLRQMKVIQQNDTLPYQQHLDSGYFEVTENTAGYPCARVTGTGQTWLQKKIAKFEVTQAKKEVAIEAIETVWEFIPF